MQKALENPALQGWIRGNLGQSSAFVKHAEAMQKALEFPALKAWREKEQEMTRLVQSPAFRKQAEFTQNYMKQVRVAEEVFPKLPNFNRKQF
jgi:hypothetical protein